MGSAAAAAVTAAGCVGEGIGELMVNLFDRFDDSMRIGDIGRDIEQQDADEQDEGPRERPFIRNEKGKLARMLERLKTGPLSTFEAEVISHRGQATIGTLREEGHVIDLVPINGVDHYVYRDFRQMVKVSKSMQEKYYLTPHWRSKSAERREFDGQCMQCHRTEDLQVHHWIYNLFAENVLTDLETFCGDCHRMLHKIIGGSKVHFPRYITAEEAERIERESV